MSIYDLAVKFAFVKELPRNGANLGQPSGDFVRYVNLHLDTLESDIQWDGLGTHSFEVAHGISRIVKLFPDKLASALAVNREFFDGPNDDGSYLIELLEKLLTRYEELTNQDLRKPMPDNDAHNFRSFRISRSNDPWPQSTPDGNCAEPLAKQMKARHDARTDVNQLNERVQDRGIADSLKRLKMLLSSAKEWLAVHDEVKYRLTVDKILQACRDFRYLTETYCRFAHPLIVEASRKDYFSDDLAIMTLCQTEDHLNRQKDLHAEFLENLSAF